MFSLLIAGLDTTFIKNIIRNILRKNEKIRLIDIVTSTDELLSVCKTYNPNIIIADADTIDVSVIDNLNYSPNCVFFTNKTLKSKDYLLRNSSTEEVEKVINNIVTAENLSEIKKELVNIFGKLKFNFSRIGTTFLIESILYSYENRNLSLYKNLEKNIYPAIANKHNTTAFNVKWVIIKSVNEMYDRNCAENSLDILRDFFYYTNNVKPTAKTILTTTLTKLEHCFKYNTTDLEYDLLI